MKLCTCNNCGNVYEDMNPQSGATDYPVINVPSLTLCFDGDHEGGEAAYWGCPICHDDGYLQDGINDPALKRIDSIIINKKLGTDCTEDDSAWVKGWLRETLIQAGTKDVERLDDIQYYFPLEYGEHLDEDRGEWEPPDHETRVFRAMEGGTDGG